MAGSIHDHRWSARARTSLVRHETLASGIATGLAGGVAMLAVAMIGAVTQDVSPLLPARVVGETFVGPGALGGATGRTAFGLLLLLATSVGLGVVFAAILPRDFPIGSALGVGVGFTLLAFMLVLMPMTPWVNPGFRSGIQPIGGGWIIALSVLGLVLGSGAALRRWATGTAPRSPLKADRRPAHPGAAVSRPARAT